MRQNALEVSELWVSFEKGSKAFHALRGISFSLEKGQTLSLVGESGSGKTTATRASLGLITPTEGKVALLGVDINNCSKDKLIETRRRCGYISQNPYDSIPPTLTTLDAVAEPLVICKGLNKKAARERAKEMLSVCGIVDEVVLNGRVKFSLSGGQKQRVALARALVTDPEIIFADEPTSMQDASNRGDILDILQEYVKKGSSLVLTTHDLYLAAAATEHSIILFHGKIMEAGPSKEILKSPLHFYTKALLDALPGLSKKIKKPSLKQGEPEYRLSGCPFLTRCPRGIDKCSKTCPPIKEVSPGHFVACWLL